MILSDINLEENELKSFLENHVKNNDFDKRKTTVENVLLEYSTNGNLVCSFPSNTLETLKHMNPCAKCIIFESYSDGWGCTYKDIKAIEFL